MSNGQSKSLSERILELAQEPYIVSGDQGSLTNPRISDLVAADEYLNRTKPVDQTQLLRSLFRSRISPPGARGI